MFSYWLIFHNLACGIFRNSSSVRGNLQNLPVAKEKIILKFSFILLSAKEIDKLKEDEEYLNCFQESEVINF